VTLKNEVGLISKFLGDAKEARHLLVHPLTGSRALQRPRAVTAEQAPPEIDPFTPEEVGMILDVIDPDFMPVVLIGVSTGLRPGEWGGLQVGDVDAARRRLHVRRTYWGAKAGRSGTRHSGLDIVSA